MKNKIFSASVVALASLAVMSCEDYNDQFNLDKTITDVRNTTITLTSTDYATIAGNETNKAIADSLDLVAGTGSAYKDALAAVGTNGYFNTMASPEDYIPAFLASSDLYRYADVGSRFTVNANFYKEPSGYLAELTNIGTYELDYYAYESAWGSNKASYLTPSTIAKMPELLAAAYPDAQAGDKLVVNYAYSNIEPGEGSSLSTTSYRNSFVLKDGETVTPIATVLAGEPGNYTVQGTVAGVYGRGFLVGDGTGTILVYLGSAANCSTGDIVTVSGTTSSYGGFMQFGNGSVVSMVGRSETFAYPEADEFSAAELDAYLEAPVLQYVSYTGVLNISGNYYNINVDGTATATGSISYPVVGMIDPALDGQAVRVTGYLIGTSSGRYVNMMATTVAPADGSADHMSVAEAAYASTGTSCNVRGIVAAIYDRGFLMTDGTGYILVYKSDTGCTTGDIVTVSGNMAAFGGFNQFDSSAEVTKVGTGTLELPAPREMDAVSMEAYLNNPYIGYVSYQGKLTISGNYYNVEIDGSTNVMGSLSYPIDLNPALDGRTVAVEGFSIGVSGGRYFNTMVTSVEGIGGVTSQANMATLYAFDGEQWSEYTNDAASIIPLDPSVYAQLGEEISDSEIDGVAASYLIQKLPYAQDGSLATVIYNSGEMSVKEYTFTAGAWIPTPECDVQTYIFEKKAAGWSADMSTYLNETFLGSTGGFTIQDISLDGLTYVWQLDNAYGWKASAYAGNTNHTTESWIVSPQINLSRGVAPFMQFDTALNFWSGSVSDFCTVMVSTDYAGDVTTANWTELEISGWPQSSSWTFYTVDLVDMSQFIGHRIYLAFRYKSNADYAPTWEIKNLKIAEQSEFTGEGGDEEVAE